MVRPGRPANLCPGDRDGMEMGMEIGMRMEMEMETGTTPVMAGLH